ncbi:MAG: PAS domain S-box protein [Acidiferrobacterales bacterium]
MSIGASRFVVGSLLEGELNINHDIAKHKRVEEQLRFHAQLLDSVRESVVATDLEGHVIFWSKGAETLYGYRTEEVMGKLITFIVEPPEAEEEEQRMQAVRTTGSWSGQYVQRRKDGTKFWADTFISLVKDASGKPCGLIGIDRDITDQKRAEQVLSDVVKGTSVDDGAYFFQSMARHLATALHVRFAFISELCPNDNRCVRLLALWTGTDFAQNFQYNVQGTPCERVLSDHGAYYASGVQKQFPEDRWLQRNNIESYHAVLLSDPAGIPIGHLGVMHDGPLTADPSRELILKIFAARTGAELKRSRVEEALRISEEHFRNLIEGSIQGILIDRNCKPIFVNQSFVDMLGYESIEEVLAFESTDTYVAPHERARFRRYTKTRLKGGNAPLQYEYDAVRKDGSIITVQNVVRVINWEGSPAIQSTIIDITEHKQAERVLRRYESIVSATSDFMSFVDTNYIYQAINTSYLRAFGKKRKQIVGHHMAKVLGEDVFYKVIKPNVDHCLAGNQVNYQLWLNFPKKGRRYLDIHYDPFRDTEGSISGVVVVVRDITESQHAEDQLRKSRERLRNLVARLHAVREEERSLIAREIHDQLGQALTGLRMDFSWLMDRMPKSCEAVAERWQSMDTLLDSALASARQLSAHLRPALLDDLGLEAAIEWQGREFARRAGCQIDVHINIGTLRFERNRETALFRILQETLTNIARHASARNVEINLIAEKDEMILEVKDDGRGITHAEITNTQSLGLIGMHERAGALGGQVQIRPLAAGGTQVTAIMPLVVEERHDSPTYRR